MPHEASTVTVVQSVEELRRELAEARQREAAANEVLRVIAGTSDVLKGVVGRSSAGLPKVLNALTEAAVRLCGADKGLIRRRDGNRYVAVSTYGFSDEFGKWVAGTVLESGRDSIVGRAASARQTVHIPDVLAEPEWESGDWQRLADFRSAIAVPLVSGQDILGVLVVHRTEPIAFSEHQIDLVETFADQAVIAIENTRLFEEVQARTRDLQEALDYQTATSDVLEIISRTPIDLQPVLAAICDTVARLCETKDAEIFIRDGDRLRLGWVQGPIGTEAEYWPISRGLVMGRAVLNRELIQVHDLRVASEEYPEGYQSSLLVGHRTIIAVPLMRKGEAVGVLTLRRTEVKPFTDRQIALLRTFADQAVIAIENARLFNDLAETVEQQSTTGEILRAIANSPGNAQAVLGSIAESAARLLSVPGAEIMRVDGQFLTLVTKHGLSLQWPIGTQRPISRDWVTGRAVVDRSTIHVSDLQTAHQDFQEGAAYARQYGHRTTLATPLLREGVPIGAILIRRMEVRPFSDKQVKLLETFADQAVIAIENTRLFEAEQASKRELQESLEYQTATSEVLSVISKSPNKLQPVLDAITQTAARLCAADYARFRILREGAYHVAASHGYDPTLLRRDGPILPGTDSVTGRAALDCTTIHVPNIQTDATGAHARLMGRSPCTVLGVPLVKNGNALGVIMLFRNVVRPFTERQIALVNTFAEQALIAMENTRLFEEVQARTRELTESLQQQTATADVLKVISRSALDVQKVLDALVESAARLCNAYDAAIFQVVGDGLRGVAHYGQIPFSIPVGQLTLPLMRGLVTGRAILERRTIQIADILTEADEYPEGRRLALQTGFRTALAVPLVHAGEAIGVIFIRRVEVRPFTERQVELVNTFADQAVIAIENTRLFEEVQARTRELAKTVEDLEIASQHKNQFVANMSHELRTPLAAILGYTELIQEGFYEPQGPKSLDALTRIRANGKHLLGLINTVLDIAKIESGQFTLNMAEYAIESVVETVRSATESLAHNKKLTLTTSVDKALPVGLGDEQRLTQVLLNLVGNAIKFTDTGEVRVTAKAIDGYLAVTVADTGPGIPAEHQTRIFDQFHQVDSSNTKAKGGTGLGLAIAKQIVEMHGGRIWVESTVGKGSTFQMEIPARAEVPRSG